jgi:molybdenum cofactor guanylyltransferase
MSPITLTTIVLAGGQSRRMGQDKALLERDRVPLLQRLVWLVQPLSRQVLVVTAWPERYGFVAEDCVMVRDRRLEGPLVGFLEGLEFGVATEWVLLLACDLPNLTAAAVQDWAAELAALPPETIAYLPQGEKGWEPLCGFYRSACRASLAAFVQSGGRSFQRWLAGQSVAVLVVGDRAILQNCNTPEDWAVVLAQKLSE